MECWYVVQTKPKREDQARGYLISKGIETFHPLMEYVSTKNGKVSTSLKPLFPGYIFSRFDFQKDYSLVKWGRGVNKIIGVGDYPTPVPSEVIQIIQQRTDERHVARQVLHLCPRDTVRITSGPLKDLVGIFDRWVSDSDRIRILLNLIGYGPIIELHYSMVERVG
jgi:transcriptional antiterminator RfaH